MKKLLFVVLALLLCVTLVIAQELIYDHFVFLPSVLNNSDITPAPVCDCSYNHYNCGDFNSQAEAQACYEYCMADVGRDVHDLDQDGDGIACEGYYYGGTPTNTPTFTPTLTPTYTPTPAPTFTPTPTNADMSTSTNTPTPTPGTVVLPTATPAPDPRRGTTHFSLWDVIGWIFNGKIHAPDGR